MDNPEWACCDWPQRAPKAEKELTTLRAENERLRGELAASRETNEWLKPCFYAGQRLAFVVLRTVKAGVTDVTLMQVRDLAREFEVVARAAPGVDKCSP